MCIPQLTAANECKLGAHMSQQQKTAVVQSVCRNLSQATPPCQARRGARSSAHPKGTPATLSHQTRGAPLRACSRTTAVRSMHKAIPAVRARERATAPVAVLPAREYNAKRQQHLQRKEEAVHAPEAGRHGALPQRYTCRTGACAHLLCALKEQLLACRLTLRPYFGYLQRGA
jgi:hypothetical protein